MKTLFFALAAMLLFTAAQAQLEPYEENGKYGYKDAEGKVIVKAIYDDAFKFSEGLAQVKLNEKYGLIDQNGKEITPIKYDEISDFKDGRARVKLNEKYGYIDKTGKEIIPLNYDEASSRSSDGKEKVSKSVSMDEFLEQAIYNGMKEDGFPLNNAKMVAQNEYVFFVTKCPICRPVQRGIEKYIQNYQETEVKISNELLDPLAIGMVEEKQRAFSKIVNLYVDRYFESCGMNEREMTDLRSKLEKARKEGMSLKSESFGPFCPSCDGACRIKN